MITRRAILAASAVFSATRASAALALADDATPAPPASSDLPDASSFLGAWSGEYAGYERAGAFRRPVNYDFHHAAGPNLMGAFSVPQADGPPAGDALEAVLLSDGSLLAVDTDSLFAGALQPDGSLRIVAVESGVDDVAALSVIGREGASPSAPIADASSLLGRWIGPQHGFKQGVHVSAMRQIEIVDATGPAFAGAGISTNGADEWSDPALVEGILLDDGALWLSTTDGYLVGRVLDEHTIQLAFLEAGMDNGALIMLLHRQSAMMDGADLLTPEIPDIDLTGTWTGESIDMPAAGGEPKTTIREMTFSDADADAFSGTKRWHIGDGKWRASKTVNAVALADGTVAMADEQGFAIGRLLAADTLEFAYLEPSHGEPFACYNRLTRSRP